MSLTQVMEMELVPAEEYNSKKSEQYMVLFCVMFCSCGSSSDVLPGYLRVKYFKSRQVIGSIAEKV